MIHRAKFQNFKALRDVEITFDSRLTVLVGPNGSGKTSVLQGMHLLDSLCHPTPTWMRQYNGLAIPDCVRAGTRIEDFLLECAARGPIGEIIVSILAGTKLVNGRGVQLGGGLGFTWTLPRGSGIPRGQENSEQEQIANVFGPSVLLRFAAEKLAAPSQPNGVPPTVQPDGTGLASTLAYQLLNQPERFEEIVAAFKRVIRPIERLRFDKLQQGGFSDVLLLDYQGARGIRAEHASTGTLLTLGLLAVILGPSQPHVILLDDLDQGLHPKAQMELIEVLRTLLAQSPKIQIIATSHSPYILDKLQPNEVRVMALKEDGSAACGRLEDHPKYPMWKDSMSPGEFWSHAGEDWVKKLSPQTAAP